MLQFKTSTITGTGSDIDVDLGFKPSYVKVINRTNLGTNADQVLEWFEGMGDDNAVAWQRADSILTDETIQQHSLVNKVSGGITILEISTVQTTDPITVTGFNGFRIPAAFQAVDDELYYIAARN